MTELFSQQISVESRKQELLKNQELQQQYKDQRAKVDMELLEKEKELEGKNEHIMILKDYIKDKEA